MCCPGMARQNGASACVCRRSEQKRSMRCCRSMSTCPTVLTLRVADETLQRVALELRFAVSTGDCVEMEGVLLHPRKMQLEEQDVLGSGQFVSRAAPSKLAIEHAQVGEAREPGRTAAAEFEQDFESERIHVQVDTDGRASRAVSTTRGFRDVRAEMTRAPRENRPRDVERSAVR